MKLFLDYLPLVVFVGVYFYSGADEPMYPAVIGLMIAVTIQNIGTRLLTGKFEKLHLWTLLITIILGGMTLVFRNPEFVQWKASIVVWIFAAVFIFREVVSKKFMIKEIMQVAIEDAKPIPEKLWKKVNRVWPIAYICFGILNLVVAYQYSEAFWVKFKLFGLMALTLVLFIYTIWQLFPYFPSEEDNSDTDTKPLSTDTNKNNNNEEGV